MRRRSPRLWIMPAVALAGLLAASGCIVRAEPPAGTDPNSPISHWFQSLTVPADNGSISGRLCCQISDCRNVQSRAKDGHLEAWIDSKTFPDDADNSYLGHAPNAWVEVPDSRILHRHDNPTGEAVACWYNGEIRCFIDGILI